MTVVLVGRARGSPAPCAVPRPLRRGPRCGVVEGSGHGGSYGWARWMSADAGVTDRLCGRRWARIADHAVPSGASTSMFPPGPFPGHGLMTWWGGGWKRMGLARDMFSRVRMFPWLVWPMLPMWCGFVICPLLPLVWTGRIESMVQFSRDVREVPVRHREMSDGHRELFRRNRRRRSVRHFPARGGGVRPFPGISVFGVLRCRIHRCIHGYVEVCPRKSR